VILPGSGVNETTAAEIVSKTKAQELHIAAVASRPGAMQYKNTSIAGMGSEEGEEYNLRTVDPSIIRRVREIAANALK
jgi:copper homeostasis protein